jgi:hypothetical protein
MPHARGKYAFGISDRSGFRYPLRSMRKEWTGALVGPDEWEPKHPQLNPPRVPVDPQSLENPRPETGGIPVVVVVGVPTLEAPQARLLFLSVRTSGVEVETP